MKNCKLLLTVWLVFGLMQACHAQNLDENRLTVYGKVRVFAKADRANIAFSIKGVGKSLKVAFAEANDRIDSLAERLYSIGLSDRNISTTFFQSGENFGNKAFLSSKRDYRAIMTASITTDSLELLESIVVILSESKIERINDISFELVEYSEVRQEALAQATSKAREKADIMCRQLGVRCGTVLAVEELKPAAPGISAMGRRKSVNPFNAPLIYTDMMLGQNAGESRIFPQEVRFDSEVKVVFEILNDEGGAATQGDG